VEVLTGALLGLSTLLFVGPVFFYLIKSSLAHSTKAGVAVAVGIIIGDIIYAVLVIKGLGRFFESEENQKWLAIAGGILLIAMGIKYLIKPTSEQKISEKLFKGSLLFYMINGFLINFVNPFVIGVWILFLGINESKFSDESSVITSFIITLFVIFIADLLKVFFAAKLKPIIKPAKLKRILQVFGVVMILFGLRLFFELF
jgi:threonine/homoserine/homoserine lactone efflux protein